MTDSASRRLAAAIDEKFVRGDYPVGLPATRRELKHYRESARQVQLYRPCPCGSGKKRKFCCGVTRKGESTMENPNPTRPGEPVDPTPGRPGEPSQPSQPSKPTR